jgi:hypothetical protein
MTDWNKPDSHAVLKIWLLIDPLTLPQAVMLVFGRDPSHHLTGRPSGYVPMITALKHAIKHGEVEAQAASGKIDFKVPFENRACVSQANMREWLKKINYTDAFFFLANPSDWPESRRAVEKTVIHEDKPISKRAETTYLNIIGGLLSLMLGRTPSGKPQSTYLDQEGIISALLANHGEKPGIAKRTLEEKMAAAKRSLNSS